MNFDLEKFSISKNASIKNTLSQIDKNGAGIIVVLNSQDQVKGVATDGDIRRGLLKGLDLNTPILECTNSDFVFATSETPREQLIKFLDSGIKFIPILDKKNKLVSFVSREHFPLDIEKPIYIRARAPVRMSFGGGGSDLTHYFENKAGAVINSAISIYSHTTMRVRDDTKIIITSVDLDTTLSASDLNDAISQKSALGLVQSILYVVKPKYGFELSINSDFPVGSGLGGSASMSTAVIACFNALRKDPWTDHEIAEIAFQAERLHFGISGGWQDQYAAVFGGFNFIEFHLEENIVNPLRINQNTIFELEESLVLCNTGVERNSGKIHNDQKASMNDSLISDLVSENVKLCWQIRNHILRGELNKFGKCLHETWKLKRKFSSKISNKSLDDIYNGALNHGALGGKLLGAGGGGFFVFYITPFKKKSLLSYLASKSLRVHPFRFEPEGLKVWISREEGNDNSELS